mmetsp:Transcript_32818/g.47891  ORF Transcript_32818/g.47891 Transcript_32818/m.47891 type:complete len:216 (-) Transcript_32818:17-664(-)
MLIRINNKGVRALVVLGDELALFLFDLVGEEDSPYFLRYRFRLVALLRPHHLFEILLRRQILLLDSHHLYQLGLSFLQHRGQRGRFKVSHSLLRQCLFGIGLLICSEGRLDNRGCGHMRFCFLRRQHNLSVLALDGCLCCLQRCLRGPLLAHGTVSIVCEDLFAVRPRRPLLLGFTLLGQAVRILPRYPLRLRRPNNSCRRRGRGRSLIGCACDW